MVTFESTVVADSVKFATGDLFRTVLVEFAVSDAPSSSFTVRVTMYMPSSR